MPRLIPWLILVGLVIAAFMYPVAAQEPHPDHNWINRFKVPGSNTDCCGKADCISFRAGTLGSVNVGDDIFLAAIGYHRAGLVKVQAVYPSPPGSLRDWACHTGCVFLSMGF